MLDSMTSNEAVTMAVTHELERRGMTRSELGRLLGHERAWVTRKLNGMRRWSVDDLDLLAERLEVEPAELLRTYRAVMLALYAHTQRYVEV